MASENECQKAFGKCKIVLLDVAGTTTSITFVQETLFSYVVENIESFLKENWETEDVKNALKPLNDDKDVEDIDTAVKLVKDAIEKQSDNIGLKTLSGLVYKQAFENGNLKAHVYPDVPSAFATWSKDRKIAIYSTGSIESQKLLFKHTIEGDLSSNITHYFDQTVGSKTTTESYHNILKELNVTADEVLWISDRAEELVPAKEAGLLTVLITREQTEEASEFPKITSFTELLADSCNKRKNEDDNNLENEPPTKLSKKKEVSEETKEKIELIICPEKKDTVHKLESSEEPKPTSNGLSDEKPEEAIVQEHQKTEPIIEMDVEACEVKVSSSEANTSECSPVQETISEKMETDECPTPAVSNIETIADTSDTKIEPTKPVECEKSSSEKLESNKSVESHSETKEITNEVIVSEEIKVDEKVVDVVKEDSNISEKIDETSEVTSSENSTNRKEDTIKAVNNVEEAVPVTTLDVKDTAESEVLPSIEVTTSTCDNSIETTIVSNLEKEVNKGVNEETATLNKCDMVEIVIEEPKLDKQPIETADIINETVTPEVLPETTEATNKASTTEKCKQNDSEVTVNSTVSETVLEEVTTNKEMLGKDVEVTPTLENIPNGKALNGTSNGCEADADTKGEECTDKGTETESQDDVKVKKIDTNTESAAVSIEA